jgi:hypothetical protein
LDRTRDVTLMRASYLYTSPSEGKEADRSGDGPDNKW